MGAGFIVDASVVVEFLAPQSPVGIADSLFAGLAWEEPLELYAPDLIFVEGANALRKLSLKKVVKAVDAHTAFTRARKLAIAVVPAEAVLDAAWELRATMTMYDACYAALARGLAKPLVTMDRKLARACTAAGIDSYVMGEPTLLNVLGALGPRKR